jgi:hypothetical protein
LGPDDGKFITGAGDGRKYGFIMGPVGNFCGWLETANGEYFGKEGEVEWHGFTLRF